MEGEEMNIKCPYCDPDFKSDAHLRLLGSLGIPCGMLGNLIVDLYAEHDQLTLFVDDGGTENVIKHIKINFCPICGRRVGLKVK